MIKLIASDIDGTLLVGKKRELNPELFDIIMKLKKQNILFVAASGRQLANMRNLFGPIEDEIFYVAENGAVCQCGKESQVLFEFDKEWAMRILSELEKFPDCKVAVSTPSTQYIKSGDEAFYQYMTGYVKYHTTVIDSFEKIREPILKIAFHNEELQEEHYKYFENMFKGEICVARSGNGWVDFIPFDSNKGTGLKYILEKLQISKDEAICFGDQENDIEMFKSIETSYAMAHAKPEVQKYATHLTKSVEIELNELLEENSFATC